MSPTSPIWIVVLLLGCAALLWKLPSWRRVPVRAVASVGVVALAMMLGMMLVNDHFGYYRTWGSLSTDLFGNTVSGSLPDVSTAKAARLGPGRLVSAQLDGPHSGIRRNAVVYLPPQYFDPKYNNVRFPVVELLHGTPGSPLQWQVALNISGVMNALIDQRRIGPTVVVMPATYSGKTFTECLDSSRGLDDTYLTEDVRTEMVRQFRVSNDAGQWGIGGFSSGGYCAANLALRHPAAFGAAASISGYYSTYKELAGEIIGSDPSLLAVNDPDQLAAHLTPGVGPLPAFWVSTGTDRVDEADAKKFVQLMSRLEPVQLLVQPNSGHQFYAWYYALPAALTWLWPQITTPDMRAMFPLSGSTAQVSIPGYKPPTAHKVTTPPPLPTVTVTRTKTVTPAASTPSVTASSSAHPPSPSRTPTPTKSSRP